MIKTFAESREVLYCNEKSPSLSCQDLGRLKMIALQNRCGRIRLCTHSSPQTKLQEMFIVQTLGCYIRPHRHRNKVESLLVLEGAADLVFFREDGRPEKVVSLGAYSTGRKFYSRINSLVYHALLIRSEVFVFHEVTEGPFAKRKTEFPKWAPLKKTKIYLQRLEDQLRRLK